jgi:ferredoxin
MKDSVVSRLVENSSGKYYVIDNCNGCGLCRSIAGNLFEYVESGKYYYIQHQPMNLQEEELMQEAIELCTMNAIRSDGDQTFFDIWNYS